MAYNYNQPPEFNTDLLATPETAQVRDVREMGIMSANEKFQQSLDQIRPQNKSYKTANIFDDIFSIFTPTETEIRHGDPQSISANDLDSFCKYNHGENASFNDFNGYTSTFQCLGRYKEYGTSIGTGLSIGGSRGESNEAVVIQHNLNEFCQQYYGPYWQFRSDISGNGGWCHPNF